MFYVYKLTSPGGKCYVGFTGQTVKERWRQHIHRSNTGYKHPLYSAMRKYGAESFTVETLGEYETAEEALQAEIDDIAALGGRKYAYNLSPGGENDGTTGVAALRAKRQDPEWEAEYRKRISEGVRKSELHTWRRPKIGEIYIQWRKENPKEAWKNTHRALRMAAKAPRGSREGYTVSPESAKKTGAGVREFWKNAPPSVRKRKSIQTRESAKKVWAERGEQARAEVGAKISETHKERYANMDSRTKQELDAQLAAARDVIDRKKQGAAASRGLKAYWENLKKDPEAYAAVQAAKAATRASKKGTAMFVNTYDIVNAGPRNRFLCDGRIVSNSGRTFQPQNLPRPTLKEHEIEAGIEAIKAGVLDLIRSDVMPMTSSALRGTLVAAPGHKFVIADLSNIEGRALAWLAGETWKLQAFSDFDTVKAANGEWVTGPARREAVMAGRPIELELDRKGEPIRKGHDLYALAYAKSFNVSPEVVMDNKKSGDGNLRQVGKVQELALGYQGGAGAFVTFAAGYGIDLDDLAGKILSAADPELVEESTSFLDWLKGRKGANTYGLEDRTYIACDVAKRGWRKGHPAISTWWPQLEDAFEKAVTTPKQTFAARSVHFNRDGSWLRVRLPSGRFLCYPNPRVKGHEEDGDVQGEPEIDSMARMSYEGVNQFSRKWARLSTYGGKLAENCIAEGTDVLTDAGWLPIEEVALAHRVWDGEEWVSHSGLVAKGHQYVKPVFGVEMTDDHLVLTEKGWKNASSCEGHNRAACRIPDGFELPRERRKAVDLEGAVRLRQGDSDACLGNEEATEPRDRGLLRMQARRDDREAQKDTWYDEPQSVCGVAKYACQMHEPEPRCLEKLRRTWNRGVPRLAGVLRGVLARYGADLPRGADAGSQGQYARVLPCELPLGHPQGASEQHQGQCDGGCPDDGAVCGRTRNIAFHRGLPNPSRGAAAPTGRSPGRVARVYDILNCGPRSRFVCRSDDGTPLIVHNCTQAFARDVLVYAMPLIEAAGYKLVMSVHDELIAEVPDDPRYSADHLAALMSTVPPWATGLPLAAEGFEAYRYRK